MKPQKIAIVGAGTGGLAAASFLQRSDHEVQLFERFDRPQPIGAGLLLQPTGLSVLSLLGLDKEIIESGSIIRKLYGKVSGGRFTILDVKYKDFAPHLFGLGVRRGNLFSALYQKALDVGVEITPSHEITDIEQSDDKACLVSLDGKQFGDFDLVVDASGANSNLRTKRAAIKMDKLYPYGAVWSIAKIPDHGFMLDTLEQRYKNADHMIGVLPVGQINGGTETYAAFFWSLRVEAYPRWLEQNFSDWQDYVVQLWPEVEGLVRQFNTHDDLSLATYRDVKLKSYHTGNLVFLGDSAHCTSPQLGQGANLALVDALALSNCLNSAGTVSEALDSYCRERKGHVAFYQTASRLLTPFFQSDNWMLAKLRLPIFGLPSKIPFTRKIAAQVLTGTRNGLFSTLNPGDWAKDYNLFDIGTDF